MINIYIILLIEDSDIKINLKAVLIYFVYK